MPSHACPTHGGAHRFVTDENDVPMCACGEVELTPDEQVDLIEIAHDGKDTPPRPHLRARIMRLLEEHRRDD